jgi:hypothetical protein
MLVIANLAHPNRVAHTVVPPTPYLPPGISTTNTTTLFRLNAQTRQVIWQHELARVTKIIPTGKTVK